MAMKKKKICNAIRDERKAKRKTDREKNKEGKKYQFRASLIRMRNETRTRCLIKKARIYSCTKEIIQIKRQATRDNLNKSE